MTPGTPSCPASRPTPGGAGRGPDAPGAFSRPYRGLSLDVGRRAVSTGAMIALVHRLGELAFTALHLHLTETHRVGVRLPGFEELAAADAWGPADLAAIAEAAREARIALIPEIDLPSHAAALLRGREHLRLVDREGTVHEDRLDVSHPEALPFASALLEAVCALVPGDAVHLGGDEYLAAPWEDAEARRPDRFPGLVAHAREHAGPDATAEDAYALFMNALARRAKELGRTPMMWNDHVVPARDRPLVPITTDAVLDVWIRWRRWTPSVTDFLEDGYRVVNSNGDLLYLVVSRDDPAQPHGRRRTGLLEDVFRPRRFLGEAAQGAWIDVPPAPPGTVDPVLGASLSLWCDAPELMGEAELMELLDTWLVPFARVMDQAG